jgi:hypothetical protein
MRSRETPFNPQVWGSSLPLSIFSSINFAPNRFAKTPEFKTYRERDLLAHHSIEEWPLFYHLFCSIRTSQGADQSAPSWPSMLQQGVPSSGRA